MEIGRCGDRFFFFPCEERNDKLVQVECAWRFFGFYVSREGNLGIMLVFHSKKVKSLNFKFMACLTKAFIVFLFILEK